MEITATHHTTLNKPLVGISSCLMGARVRYDGKTKLNQKIQQHLGPFVEWLPICPEAAVGLGIPRPPVQLIDTGAGIHAIGRDDERIDVTAALSHFGDTLTGVHQNLCGYIFQSRSPSCGVGTTPVHNKEKQPIRTGNGLVAEKLIHHFPHIPIVNDTDLNTEQELAGFLAAVVQVFNAQHCQRY